MEDRWGGSLLKGAGRNTGAHRCSQAASVRLYQKPLMRCLFEIVASAPIYFGAATGITTERAPLSPYLPAWGLNTFILSDGVPSATKELVVL